MIRPAFGLALLGLAVSFATPASALVIGMSPDPLVTPLAPFNTQVRVEFLGATVGTLPTGGILIDGTIGANDDVIMLRFTNTGPVTIIAAAAGSFLQAEMDVTALGDLPGGLVAVGGGLAGPDLGLVDTGGMTTGQFIDVFFAFADLDAGELVSLAGYAIGVSQDEVSFLLPEPSLGFLLLAAVAVAGRRR